MEILTNLNSLWALLGLVGFSYLLYRNYCQGRVIADLHRTNEQYKERFQALFDNISDGVAIYEADQQGSEFIIRDMNQAGLTLNQTELHELTGRPVTECFPGVKDLGLFAIFQNVWQSGRAESLCLNFYKDATREAYVKNYVCKLPSGEVMAIFQDCTDQKKVIGQLERAKQEWEMTFDSLTDIVTLQDRQHHILRANKAAARLFGREPADLIGQHCYQLFCEEEQPCSCCPQPQLLGEGPALEPFLLHCTSWNKIFQISISHVDRFQGGEPFFVHVARDVTKEKKLEEELWQAQKIEEMGTLAGGIAHDFNNVLSVIIGSAELIQKELEVADAANEDIENILVAARRGAELAKQILAFSRRQESAQKVVCLNSLVQEGLMLLRRTIPTSITLQEDIASKCGSVFADETAIHQVLINLCTNAMHSMTNKKGTLRVALEEQEVTEEDLEAKGPDSKVGLFVVLSVGDTGCGMDEEIMKRIFEPYFTTKEKGVGTGLGLSVIHGIMRSCNGFVTVDSIKGEGSTFSLYFPKVTDCSSSETAKVQEDMERLVIEGQAKRLLVVDDDPLLVRVSSRQLTDRGFIVRSTTDSMEALHWIQENPEKFDLLITDQIMPQLTGVELAAKANEIRPGLPVIICTGNREVISGEEALAIGIRRYVNKPVRGDELGDAVEAVFVEVMSEEMSR